ncbi:DEAD/DEAH box helicase family protein [Marinobacter adhaerens]|nr:DEAD/DEAH box helicase family protein [Marinobacter adhaerens]
MGLFPNMHVTLTLPEHKVCSRKIEGNLIERFGSLRMTINVSVEDGGNKGLLKLTSDLAPPFDTIYLVQWRRKPKIPENVPCLRLKNSCDIKDIDEDTEFVWVQYPCTADHSPHEILETWKGGFHFIEDDPAAEVSGLRRPQLGALHSIAAHFSTDEKVQPATVVLPTGTGKTETMIAAMVYLRLSPILLVVPSNSLREQLFEKFINFGCLPELGVVGTDSSPPYVAKLTKGLKSKDAASELASCANVIIATPNSLQSGDISSTKELCRRCSYLFIDEAHHVSAKSWSEIRDHFSEKVVMQFTATPFRNDRQALGGKIIFNFTMGEAQRAGYFKPIILNSVEEFQQDTADEAIATKAVALLDRDIEAGYDHLLMARAKSKSRANDLVSIYRKVAPHYHPIVVHSTYSKARNSECLEHLLNRRSRIVVCVDMLGEGYDLPNLKVAAIHDIHKSLAIALQFIGRFTRAASKSNVGDSSVVLNTADPSVEGSLQRLYAQGADWDSVLRRLSESRIDREIQLQEVVDSLKDGSGDLSDHISLWNLTPSYSAVLFDANCEDWLPNNFVDVMGSFDNYWHSISAKENILVVLGVQNSPVKWGTYRNLSDTAFKLLIAQWDPARNALFVFSSDYKAFRVEQLAQQICGSNSEPVSGKKIFNILNGIEFPLVRNLGASQVGAISFTQFFGPNVTDGLTQIEASKSSLSNIAARGYEDGECVVWGCSQKKGKIWSPQKSGSLADWSDWVKGAWDKVAKGGMDEDNITRDFLRPEAITKHHSAWAISVQWGEQILSTYEERVDLCFGTKHEPFYLVDIALEQREECGEILISVFTEELSSTYRLTIFEESPGFNYELIDGPELYIKIGNSDYINFSEYMHRDPVLVQYVDGAFSYNKWLVQIKESVGLYDSKDIEVRDWSTVNIRSESMGRGRKSDSVQYHSFLEIKEDYDVIIDDDGKGEAADLVAIKVLDQQIVLHLIHCKYSGAADPGARLKDLYEVCGQAQRSIHWKHNGMLHLYKHLKHREGLWNREGATRFLKGDLRDLTLIKNRSRASKLNLEISIVQPGISVNQTTDEMLKLLGCTSLFIKKMTEANLNVIGSK